MKIDKLFLCLVSLAMAVTLHAVGVASFSRTVTANGKTFALRGVKINLNAPSVSLKVGLAAGLLGRTESLAGIATRYHAVAAINGSFFDAYTNDTLKNPDMSLISGGQLIFKSGLGCMIGFEANNTPHMASVRYNLFGSIAHNNGYPLRWYAYWMNRKPTATPCVTMFTRQWGAAVDPMGGTSVVIEDGAIDAITNQRVAIPEHGYVVHFRGEDSLLARFHVGDRITFAPEMTVNGDDPAAWGNVTEAVGAGPRVLTHGTPVFTPAAEGFSDQKILQLSGARSAAGYTSDGVLYLITTRGARVSDLGHILKALGCVEGMNLDGGASSGLWYRGSYLTTPGRQISNALLVVERK